MQSSLPPEETLAPLASTFEELGVSDDLVRCLRKQDVVEPFPVQSLTIPDALAGRDICGKAKTGSGKTFAFGIPLVERTTRSEKKRPRGLVLVPTRELAVQVTASLEPLARTRGLKVATIYGGASIVKQINALLKGVDIVIVTPGRMIDLMERGAVSVLDVETVVVDEADHMADLGFLPQVDRILSRIRRRHQTLLFSATLDGMVDTLVRRYMHEPVFHEVQSEEITVQTMEHRFLAVHPTEKSRAAAVICQSAKRVLVFVRTQHRADRVASQLGREGVNAGSIHGGLRQSHRERVLRDFSQGKVRALVATNVAARGLHVEGVDIVLHFDAPEDHKTYLHRSGRTARAGEAGLVVTFIGPEHLQLVKEMQALAGLDHQIVPMTASDERLRDLTAWQPPTAADRPEPKVRRSRLSHRTSYRRRRGRR